MTDQDRLKRAAAEAALEFLPVSGAIGLGSGSTALHMIAVIGARLAAGLLSPLTGVATSRATAQAARQIGIRLLSDDGPWDLAVTFDGADEVSPALDLIKGGGGALLREKIVNAASALNVILIDESTLSAALGERFRLPVEVTPFGWGQTARAVEALSGPARLREGDGSPFVTDNGNLVLDVETGPIPDPAGLERALESIPGVVVSGLFVARADVVIIAGAGGVEIRRRTAAPSPGAQE